MKSETQDLNELHIYDQDYSQQKLIGGAEEENMTHHESAVDTTAPITSSKLCPSPDVVPYKESIKELTDTENNQENLVISADENKLMSNHEKPNVFVFSTENHLEYKNSNSIKDDVCDLGDLKKCDSGAGSVTRKEDTVFTEEYVADFFKSTIPELLLSDNNVTDSPAMMILNPSITSKIETLNNNIQSHKQVQFNDNANSNECDTKETCSEKSDNYLPDVIPAIAANKTNEKSEQENSDKPCNKEIEVKSEQEKPCMNTVGTEEETSLTSTLSEKKVIANQNKVPLKSVLKKGTSSKKNLRVSFSDCEKCLQESEANTQDSTVLNPIIEMQLTDWDHWEAFSSLKISLDNSSDKFSDPFGQENEPLNSSSSACIIKGNETSEIQKTDKCSDSIDETKQATFLKSASVSETSEITTDPIKNADGYQALTEANLKQHERLLLNDSSVHKDSDSETSSSQDTIILMTSEESKRNQESIELSQRRYKQQTQGGSSSSSHDSEESLPQHSSVSRSNSAIRRSLERTALRRSLTRCAEIRRKIKEKSIKRNPERDNSSLMEKLRILTEECDLQDSSENQDMKNETLKYESHELTKNKALLPRLDLEQVQTLMNGHQSIHKFYTSKTNIDVPRDVRQWKLHSKLTDKKIKDSCNQSNNNFSDIQEKLINVLSDNINGQDHFSEFESNETVLSETESNDSHFDELEQFVQQDQDRIERIRKRYNVEENEYEVIGFYRRPSVRGIRPKFGSTTQIIKQLQQQLNPPLMLQRTRSHFTWPYVETNNNELIDDPPANYLPTMTEVPEPDDTILLSKHLLDNDGKNYVNQAPIDMKSKDIISPLNNDSFPQKDNLINSNEFSSAFNTDIKNPHTSFVPSQKIYAVGENGSSSPVKDQICFPPPYIPPPDPVRHVGASSENLANNCQINPFKNPNYATSEINLNGKIISSQIVKNGVVYFALDV